MIARAGDRAVDGQRVTAADVDRQLAAEAEQLDRTAAAVWTLAAAATDVEECRLFLGMLGLDAVAVAHARRRRNYPSRSSHWMTPSGRLWATDNRATATAGGQTERCRARELEHR